MPWSLALLQYNLLDSHDVPRIRTLLGGHEALQRLAAIVQFTYPEAPGLYYGDKIGMEDVTQLAQWACLIWDERRWNQGLLGFY